MLVSSCVLVVCTSWMYVLYVLVVCTRCMYYFYILVICVCTGYV